MSDSEEDVKEELKGRKTKEKLPASKSSSAKATAAITLQGELLEDFLSTLESIKTSTNLSKARIQTFQNRINSDLDNANKYNKNIIGNSRIPDEDLNAYLESKVYKRIKDTYWNITSDLTERLAELDVQNAPKNQSTKTFESEFRLPRLDLPPFTGLYEDWLPFDNLFTSSVHSRANLDPVEKLYYLMTVVTGDAKEQIKNLSITGENYTIARQILEEQYNHPRKIAHTYMKKLLNIDQLTSENSKDIKNFISNTKDCLSSLQCLGIPTDKWDYLLLFNLQSKIPPATSVKWEEHLGASREIPNCKDFLKFLEERFRTLEMVEIPIKEKDSKRSQKALHIKSNPNGNPSSSGISHSKNPSHSRTNSKPTHKSKNFQNNPAFTGKRPFVKTTSVSCGICKQNHPTSQCNNFRNNTALVRRQLAKQHKLCFNCLGSSHTIDVCYSTKTCVYCKQAHHSLLHIHEFANPTNASVTQPAATTQNASQLGHTSGVQTIQQPHSYYASSDTHSIRILGTALVRVVNASGYSMIVRALLDSGADDNYIINATVQNAGLKKYSAVAAITGLNDVTVGSTNYKVNFEIQSLDGCFKYDSSAFVVETITSKMPSQYIDPENFGSLNNLSLADPHFNQPGKVQLLLGVGFIVRIRKPGLKRFKDLLAEQTLLGWVVMGQCSSDGSQSSSFLTTRTTLLTKSVNNDDLSKQIQKFFEIEEFSERIPMKPEDALCEAKFVESVKRCADGKLSVELPFREDGSPVIGPSKHIAMRRFLNLEKKLENNITLKEEYSKTFTEYLNEGHLLLVTKPSLPGQEFFLPHHAVMKASSTTTKVRVVFDGSCKSADSTSLNDHLLTGRKLQTDIRDVFFNWRKYQYALTADIAKMYRMFWIDEKHRDYQKVLWRFKKEDPISEYCLATVTFGTSSAPFQAIRALHYIAEREGSKYPLGCRALLSEFYVDDFISGSHSIPEAIRKQTELREVLSQYGLIIRKWSSNKTEALQGINDELKETLTELRFEEEEFRKTLGVFWAPKGDYFSFSTSHFQIEGNKLTKRIILSLIARLYDPLGWVGPCTLYAKMIMQRIWEQNINWDDDVCGQIKIDFVDFLNDLPQLTNLKFSRWVGIQNDTSPLTLYGFSDASLKAYGAVIYLKNPNPNDSKKLILLASRTRVKPLKHITLARLELCAAVMLSELIDWAKTLLKSHKLTILAFSDSKIVLSWLNSHPSRWKMYIASRTTKILDNIKSDQWAYVNTKHNPADLASRGLLPSDLIANQLWWNGPNLSDLNSGLPTELSEEDTKIIGSEIKETKPVLHVVSSNDSIFLLLTKYSSHGKMCRIMGYVTDFLKLFLLNMKRKFPSNAEKYQKMIQAFPSAENQIFRQVQRISFASEIKALENREPLPRKSRLCSHHPFLDGFGILRVGGRLDRAHISYNQKHPIILPSHHQVSTNLIHLAHHATLHGPNSLTASYLRFKFHILRCTDRIKVILRGCPRCIKLAKLNHEQLMGSLPTARVNPHRPFLHTGVDYAGPFNLKAYKGRCNKILKSYVALFVCFSTKAIHLELVTELTATAFLAAFRRFTSRRGQCLALHSDCGTNFIKGNKLLVDEVSKAQQSWKTELSIDFERMGTKWEFNPPGSPHFGGLWEAGVKSMKTHLNKTFGNNNFTSEELNTVLIQIEGILNSRPLCPLSSDPTDFSALTPAHFLIGECIVSPPDRYYELEAKHPVDRWQYLQKLKQMFWASWKREYLHRLNARPKWKSPGIEFKKDDLVILTEENTPATYWPMAIIVETHPGKDGITRVVTLKTTKGQILKRPISKLRLLAYDPEDFQMSSSTENPNDSQTI